MSKNLLKRIVANITLLLSTLLLPWWTSLGIVLTFAFYFDRYYEAIIAGALLDFTFSSHRELFGNFILLGFLTSSLILFIVEKMKLRLRVYETKI